MVLCETEVQAQAALRSMAEYLQTVLHLQLKPAKTQYSHIDLWVQFLGVQLSRTQARIPAEKLVTTLETAKNFLSTACDLQLNAMQRAESMQRLNALTRGFRNYFSLDNAADMTRQLAQLDADLDTHVQTHGSQAITQDLMWSLREKFCVVDESRADSQISAFLNNLGLYGYDEAQNSGAYNTPTNRLTQTFDAGDSAQNAQSNSAIEPASGVVCFNINGAVEAEKAEKVEGDSAALNPSVFVAQGRLHVLQSGCYVTMQGHEVVVRQRKREIYRSDVSALELLYLEGRGIALSADLAMALCERDVILVFTPVVGLPSAIVQPIQTLRSHLRQIQVLRRNDRQVMQTGLSMLSAKIANQASVLKYFARYRKKTDRALYEEITRCADEVRQLSATVEAMDGLAGNARAVAMGMEGRAAAKYWGAAALLVPSANGFIGRHAHNATDPVNMAVNYCYGILYGEVWRVLLRSGLDPYFGIMHGSVRDQGSLVFDLIEEFRGAFADRVVLGLLGRGLDIRLDKQDKLHSAVRVKLALAFYKLWQKPLRWNRVMKKPADILSAQANALRFMYEKDTPYNAFRFRW